MFLMELREEEGKADLGRVDIFEDDVGAGDVDHVQAAADDQTALMEVVSMSFCQSCKQSWVFWQLAESDVIHLQMNWV